MTRYEFYLVERGDKFILWMLKVEFGKKKELKLAL